MNSSKKINLLKRPSTLLIILAILFGVPLFGSYFMAKESAPMTDDTTNRGTLISPILPLTELDLETPQGTPVTPEAFQGKWLMLYVNTAPTCDATCDENLYHMRQVRAATGKNINRVGRAILTFTNTPKDQHLENVLNVDFEGTTHFTVSKNTFADFVINSTPAQTAVDENSIFLVDPLGNVMMIYTQDTPPMDMLKDINRLLKFSRIG